MKITRSEILRIASLNIDSTSANFMQRLDTVIAEAVELGVEIILLQEIASNHKSELLEKFNNAGYAHHFITEGVAKRRDMDVHVSTGIISKHPLTSTMGLKPTLLTGAYRVATGTIAKNGYNILLMSAHLLWGGENVGVRLKQVHILNDYAQRFVEREPDTLCILGGTLNDEPDADSIRYLTGKKASAEDSRTSYWVEATHNSELQSMPTTRMDSSIWQDSARSAGILAPEFVPPVKNDYLFSKGWVYGRPGMPFNTQIFGTYLTGDDESAVSDHYGFVTDIWIPTK